MMFTGIVREMGEILAVVATDQGVTFRIGVGELYSELDIGHSVSVDGVCLTVTGKSSDRVEVDVSPESLRRSNLGLRKVGDRVNLEPAVKISDALGGHLVQGHVDATGTVTGVKDEGNSVIFGVSAPPEVMKYCVFKGSVALNGISLTISKLGSDYFEVTIIPHTLEVTNMAELKTGDQVNLEADLISKYVENHVNRLMAESVAGGDAG